MKKHLKPNTLSAVTVGLGGIALVLRRLVYLFALDEKNLLIPGHPLSVALLALTAVAMGWIVFQTWKLDNIYPPLGPNIPATAGHVLAASGIAVTVLLYPAAGEGSLRTAWTGLGILASVCLLPVGFARMGGRKPFFLLHLASVLFLLLHLLAHYRIWSSNPQLLDYVFPLLGTMALLLFAFYNAAFCAGLGKRRVHTAVGLAAVYLCLGELAASQYPYLYLGCILWVLTDLYHPQPTQTKEA